MNLNSRKRRLDDVALMNSRTFKGSAKDCLNQEIADQYQNLMHHQINDDPALLGASSSHGSFLPIYQPSAGFGFSLGSYDTNLPNSGLNYLMASNSGSGKLGLDAMYNLRHFQSMPLMITINAEFSQDDHRGYTMLIDSDDSYWGKTPFEAGAQGVFTEPTKGDNMELDKFISLTDREYTSAQFSKSKLRHGYLPNYGLQAHKSGPPAHVEQRGFSNVQTPSSTDSTSILIEYISFKSSVNVLERRQQEFMNHLHHKLCKVQMCKCEEYHNLILHFQGCHNTLCILCQPVHGLCNAKKMNAGPIYVPCPVKKVTSKSGKSNLYVSRDFHDRDHILPDMQPAPKRMKVENAAKFDNWSLFAVILPHLKQCEGGQEDVEDYMDKANKEPLSSKEASATPVAWNETADNGGSMESTKSDELLGMGQSPEGHISSAPMNEVPTSRGNLGNSLENFNDALNLDNIKLGNDDAVTPSEEHRLVVEQHDGGCIKTSKMESVTFGGQSTLSDGINVLPQGNLGKSLQTSTDALDLADMELGEDVTISHSKGQYMVDEEQEIDCVKTSKVMKSDVTYGFQDLNSTNISALPQILDLGRSLRTFNDGHSLDNINLGIDAAISHSEENNLVDKQQEIGCVTTSKVESNVTFSPQSLNSKGISVLNQDSAIDEEENSKLMSQVSHETVDATYAFAVPDNQCGRKLDDLKASGVALTDFFTAEQMREHLCSLNQDISLDVGQELHASMYAHTGGSNTCQLCALDTLTFTALAMCCTSCGAPIKHKVTYYWTKDGAGTQYFFCTICFKEARGGKILCKGISFPKAELYKGKNTEESGEPWVQCDRCERWQHQICALYNSERDLKGKAKYICPVCRFAEIKDKGHMPITPVLGAQELPRTKLSDYIEQRLFGSLQRERKQRAEFLGKNPEEVPGASDLTVRVVLSVNKQLRVKQQFLDILHGETYPEEFPYKSKVVLLFQKVGGVDVCIFAMYVQEFGSECGNPNKRSVYISYLDSVKYFRPEIKTVAGVALRTFVYHEILIGYLDYCKRLGFITCYIWACPPWKGEDYILHCHPETQKRPNSHKLAQWYKKMLKKGKEENVVVEFTNFYDYFFVPNGDSNCKITAARLPYFDGDYWSRAIEDLVQAIENGGGESDRQLKNHMTKRTMKAMGHNDLSADATKDIIVMQKLGHRILTAKEEFFVVHLQFTCTNCHEAILSGSCWSCNQCSKFSICSRCLESEHSSNLLETHTGIFGDKHQLYKIPVNDEVADTNDNDGLLENEFFDDRLSFLNFCEKNFYRFDTLRRAKHSSMMIIHHLHEQRSRAMEEAMCSICNQNVVAGWHCEMCSQFHVCDACFQREGDHCHLHKLVKHLIKDDSRKGSEQMHQQLALEADSIKKSEQIQQYRISEILDLLEHASKCLSTKNNPCSNPKCFPLKNTFRHTRNCTRRVAGGCEHCKRIWDMLVMHSNVCEDSNCRIPRCMDIKNYRRKQTTKSDLSREVV
ncbi:histone acetyltransferase [Salvia divinorum]|uniref:histone acetyltransferase n=1 Tax=Salvia divinorum TaxID=28513 RepID=A0ABD1G4T1_SALDI